MSSEAELKALSTREFWDNRYASETVIPESEGGEQTGEPIIGDFEWFRDFKKLRPWLEKKLTIAGEETGLGKGIGILHLGCGNSTLTSDLSSLSFTNQVSIDFSQVLINAMMQKYASLNTTWRVMDVRKLEFLDSSFDICIDKGTLDVFLWDPPEDVVENVGAYVDQVARVLKPGGKWLYITNRQPHFIKPLLIREDKWKVEVEVLEDPDGAGGFEYFGFVMTKHNQNANP